MRAGGGGYIRLEAGDLEADVEGAQGLDGKLPGLGGHPGVLPMAGLDGVLLMAGLGRVLMAGGGGENTGLLGAALVGEDTFLGGLVDLWTGGRSVEGFVDAGSDGWLLVGLSEGEFMLQGCLVGIQIKKSIIRIRSWGGSTQSVPISLFLWLNRHRQKFAVMGEVRRWSPCNQNGYKVSPCCGAVRYNFGPPLFWASS